MDWFTDGLRENPELAIFLTLAIGFLIGRLKIGSFALGNVVGTLIAGVVVGQVGVKVDPLVKIVFFDLFLFATGYKVGPQFFRGLKKNALTQVSLTVVLCVTSLVATFAAAKVFRYDVGTAAGLMAGAFTESTVIGTASDAIGRLDLPEAEKERLRNNIPVAYAVSYLVGTGFVVWFLSSLAPRLLKVNLKEEARKLEAQLAGGRTREPGTPTAYREWVIRAFRLSGDSPPWKTVGDLERAVPGQRIHVKRVRRAGEVLETAPGMELRSGDVVAIAARRKALFEAGFPFANEVEDRDLLDFPLAARDVVVTNREVVGRTLQELADSHGRGVALLSLVRAMQEIPFTATTTLDRGDLLRIAGSPEDVERAGKALGYVERPSSETDVVFVGLGILVGGFVGLLTVTVGGLPLSLTASGGALIMGLVFGWLRSVRPTFGRIPEPALWVFDTIGLAVFIGVVGLSAGPTFVAGLRQTGPSLLLVGFVVAVTPHVTALLFGRYVLKMNPVILLGACSGAGTVTAALRGIQDEADSKLPVLGYTVPYAIGNILLTAWGPVIVMLLR
ncbi:aspartate-alanine antiporter [Acidobacteria bacterium ACD]|nr:MAG: aspartate-alanine antiporter [Acidobacteriota bacterium]MCE7957006.1 aspartate-alanine antiporter [Acidobacteria bacterium ACB2]MDL1948524.1 aspartate-alanine antiporter [Acidobacteria bacterium ACD]